MASGCLLSFAALAAGAATTSAFLQPTSVPSAPSTTASSCPRYAARGYGPRMTAEATRSAAVGLDEWSKYCEDTKATKKRATRTVWAGKVPIGSEHPIARQTMTTTDTNDVEATVEQVIRCADAGADLVRITVQGKREARACKKIREVLDEKGYDVPLVADIHFQPAVAMEVAEAFEKIRINPGNFVDGRKTFEEYVYDSKEEFDKDLGPIEESFKPLVLKCKELGRAMRIGTNHGSLSARVLSYYGDTPRGMVESAVEFAEICRKYDYHNFVFSMKASNPLVMVQAYRLLAAEQYRRGWDYPLHLGVTEAGEGEDGRMKSAIGIGALLMDGLGDTIRVSLTEDPEYELSPCAELAEIGKRAVANEAGHEAVPAFEETARDFKSFERRAGALPEQQDGDPVDVRGYLHRDGSVIVTVSLQDLQNAQALYQKLGFKTAVGMPFRDIATCDSVYLTEVPASDDKASRTALRRMQEAGVGVLAPIEALEANPVPNAVAVVALEDATKTGGQVSLPQGAVRLAVSIKGSEDLSPLSDIAPKPIMGLLNVPAAISRIHASRRVFQHLADTNSDLAIIHHASLPNAAEMSQDQFILSIGAEVGGCLVDGLGDGVMVEAPGLDTGMLRTTCFGLLQASHYLMTTVVSAWVKSFSLSASGLVYAFISFDLHPVERSEKAESFDFLLLGGLFAQAAGFGNTDLTAEQRQVVAFLFLTADVEFINKLQGADEKKQPEHQMQGTEHQTHSLSREQCVKLDVVDAVRRGEKRIALLLQTNENVSKGCRMRNTKTEYVSCPSCGRTLFDLQEVTAQISERTGHLPGVAIAIMGCIVNGVGEMADADFGYVGGAPGKVDLYVGKELVQRGIPNEQACDSLIQLIKDNGRWVEKDPVEETVPAEVAA